MMKNYRHKLSIWESQSLLLQSYDVVIVGAGITGLSTALHLVSKKPFLKVLIVEKLPIGAGASSRNAGFACIGSISELESDLKIYGQQVALSTVQRRYEGLRLLRSVIGDGAMEYKAQTGLEVFNDRLSFEKAEKSIDAWNLALRSITGLSETFKAKKLSAELNFYEWGVENKCEGLINTGLMYKSFYNHIANLGVQILNSVTLASYAEVDDKVELRLEGINQIITANQLIICTNAFSKQLLPQLEVTPCRNQVIVTSPLKNMPIKNGCHFDNGYIYFRPVENRILIGGARNLFSEEVHCDTFGINESNISYLRQFLQERIIMNEEFTLDYEWSGILTGGKYRSPIVKAISEKVMVGIRLGGMGVAIGSIIGKELATLSMGRAL